MTANALPVPSGIEGDQPGDDSTPIQRGRDVIHHLTLCQQHLRLIQVVLHDRTDTHNELVFEHEWLLHPAERELALPGNLFVIEDVHTGEGRILLKPEPLPHARPDPLEDDLRVSPRPDTGFDFELLGSRSAASHAVVELAYRGGTFGRIQALHRYQMEQRPATDSHRLPCFLSNTWGDRSRDSRIQHDFIAREIEAGSRLGVEVVQIDDGWMKGVTKNSARSAQTSGVWEGFWNQDPNFWQPSRERFPDGLEPLVEKARSLGMGLGLWFGPDSWNDFANWRRDADCLLDFYHRLGIAHFKLDGIRMDSTPAQANLGHFFEAVLAGSQGQVVFDLDVTAQTRPGYFGALNTGAIFVENRYTDWHRYWPHQTLRNLWKLARWVDPRRLRMEFLNHSRNLELYPDDPLSPSRYAPDALFAAVMISSPLGWFEVSNLPESYFEKAAPLVKLWKQVRAELFGGTIIPLGQAPDGVGWTGFASVGEGGKDGYILLFRELSSQSRCRMTAPGFQEGAFQVDLLAGSGTLAFENGWLSAEIPDKLGYLFGAVSK